MAAIAAVLIPVMAGLGIHPKATFSTISSALK
jgi:Flp pilus assembly pilin Flp